MTTPSTMSGQPDPVHAVTRAIAMIARLTATSLRAERYAAPLSEPPWYGPDEEEPGRARPAAARESVRAVQSVFAGIPGLDPSKAFAIPILVTNNTSKPIVRSRRSRSRPSRLPFSAQGILPAYGTPIAPASVKVIVYVELGESANQSVTLGFIIPMAHDCDDTDLDADVIPGVFIDSFPPCSSRVPFPTGAPTCDPPCYEL